MEQRNGSLCPCYKREIANKVIPLTIWRAFSLIFLVFHFSLFLDCLPGFLLSVSPSSPAPSSPSRSPSGGKSRSRRKSATSSAARAARRIHAARRAMSLEKPACSPGRNVQGTSSSCTNGTRRRGFPAHFRGVSPLRPVLPPSSAESHSVATPPSVSHPHAQTRKVGLSPHGTSSPRTPPKKRRAHLATQRFPRHGKWASARARLQPRNYEAAGARGAGRVRFVSQGRALPGARHVIPGRPELLDELDRAAHPRPPALCM